MKKVIGKILLVAGLGLSLSATANPVVSGGTVAPADCALLAETVTLNLSKNVHGSWNCDEARTIIKVAACHEAGSRKPTQVQCVVTDPNATPPTLSPSGCAAAGEYVEIANYRAYVAASSGGSIGEEDLGANCADATVDGLGWLTQ